MTSRPKLLIFCAALWVSAAMTARATPVADVSQQWVGYWNAKNLNATLTLYAPEPVFLPSSGERWEGMVTIRKNFARLLKRFDPRLTMQSRKSEMSGNLAYDSGSFDEVLAPAKGGKAIRARGNYLFVFQRKSKKSGWKILEQFWTEFDPSKM